MKAKTKQIGYPSTSKVKYNPALDALAGKNLFPEKLADANQVLAKGGLPKVKQA